MKHSIPAEKISPAKPFKFTSYGVNVEIAGNDQELIDQAEAEAIRSLVGNARAISKGKIDHRFELNLTPSGTFIMIQNGERIATGRSRRKFLKLFDSMIRVSVGEYAVDRVFLHAGVVGWKGKAIVIPADSFRGKTTLVAELVRAGASYYSDEFAVFDREGLVHAFPRPLAMRSREGKYREYKLTPEDLGGTYGTAPIPAGMILLTGYAPGKRWTPKLLTPGQGVMGMLPFALSLRHRPDFSLEVLNNIASRAIIASSLRGTAEKFAKILLNFVDKHVD